MIDDEIVHSDLRLALCSSVTEMMPS